MIVDVHNHLIWPNEPGLAFGRKRMQSSERRIANAE